MQVNIIDTEIFYIIIQIIWDIHTFFLNTCHTTPISKLVTRAIASKWILRLASAPEITTIVF